MAEGQRHYDVNNLPQTVEQRTLDSLLRIEKMLNLYLSQKQAQQTYGDSKNKKTK
jgi:hypothetical protein